MSDRILELSGVTFRYGETPELPPVLEDVSLSVVPGDFLGVIGPNGSGKTTLLKIILGLLEPDSGTVEVLGTDPKTASPDVGYVPQHAQIDATVPATVLDVVLTGRLGLSGWGLLYGKKHLAAARDAMEQVGVGDLAKRRIGELSGGQRQRVLIARALAADVRILLLDEPMAGVDAHMEQGILETLQRLNERMPIVMVSHDIGLVSTHLKRVACLNRRMVVHRADEVSGEVIAEMYAALGPVSPVGHQHDCPLPDTGDPS